MLGVLQGAEIQGQACPERTWVFTPAISKEPHWLQDLQCGTVQKPSLLEFVSQQVFWRIGQFCRWKMGEMSVKKKMQPNDMKTFRLLTFLLTFFDNWNMKWWPPACLHTVWPKNNQLTILKTFWTFFIALFFVQIAYFNPYNTVVLLEDAGVIQWDADLSHLWEFFRHIKSMCMCTPNSVTSEHLSEWPKTHDKCPEAIEKWGKAVFSWKRLEKNVKIVLFFYKKERNFQKWISHPLPDEIP